MPNSLVLLSDPSHQSAVLRPLEPTQPPAIRLKILLLRGDNVILSRRVERSKAHAVDGHLQRVGLFMGA